MWSYLVVPVTPGRLWTSPHQRRQVRVIRQSPAARPEERVVDGVEPREGRIGQDIGKRRAIAEKKGAAVAKLVIELIEKAESIRPATSP